MTPEGSIPHLQDLFDDFQHLVRWFSHWNLHYYRIKSHKTWPFFTIFGDFFHISSIDTRISFIFLLGDVVADSPLAMDDTKNQARTGTPEAFLLRPCATWCGGAATAAEFAAKHHPAGGEVGNPWEIHGNSQVFFTFGILRCVDFNWLVDVGGFSGIQSTKMVVLWDLMGFNQQEMVIWLVVTGTWLDYFSIYWEFHDPNRLIFFRGVETTNQCWFQYLSENLENEERSLWMTFPSSFEIYTWIHYQNWKLLGGSTSSTPNSKCDIVI